MLGNLQDNPERIKATGTAGTCGVQIVLQDAQAKEHQRNEL
jgi:hypothetical protein